MGDNDFPVAMGGVGSSIMQPLGQEYLRKKFLQDYLPKVPDTQKPTGYFREELGGERTYAQSGTNIPSFNIGQTYGQTEGGPVFSQTVAQGIPVGQDPIFPMSQEEFSDYIRNKQDQRVPLGPTPANLMRKIEKVGSKYGFGSV